MKTTLSFLLLLSFVVNAASAQTTSPTTAELIDQALSTFDLPPFEWEGEPEPLRPRIGIYFNAVPADTVAARTGKTENDPWFVIWHVMPHWSADEAGIMIGDTITAINGRAIGDSNYYGEDFVNLLVREMQQDEIVMLSVRRNGEAMEMPVPVIADERVPMSFTVPAALGPVRERSWLATTLAGNGLTEWARGIAKQMRIISDMDMSRIRFAGRPNPWRLNAITCLHNNPTRTGAYSRLIVDDLWNGADAGPGLSRFVTAAAMHLDVPVAEESMPLPANADELTEYLVGVRGRLNRAYQPAGGDIAAMTTDLALLLDPDESWEGELDSVGDPFRKRELRNSEERRITLLFEKADKVNLAELVAGASRLAALADTNWLLPFASKVLDRLGTNRRGAAPPALPGVDGEIVHAWHTPFGTCVIGGPGPNRYTGSSLPFIIDLGGNDHYDLSPAPAGTSRFIADLAGDDVYLSSGAAQGAGVGSVDVLVDVAGDDTYRADNFSQGAGLLGVGLLADFAGNDVYTSHWCSQGAAFLGIGLLYEGGGADSYNGDIYMQGFGYAKGFGAVLENGGNDAYRAGWMYEDSRYPDRAHIAMSQGFGFGMRPWSIGVGTDGGIGTLSDRAGDDVYVSDFFSQGGSYWYALGILHDGNGADRYTAGQYSQGSGIHLSFGALLDDAGDDMYDAYHGLEQGNAHDWSAGCLEDLRGNDTYRGSTASQGSALNVSFAWLLDREGNDRYYVLAADTTSNQGGGNYNRPRKHGSLGMLLDFGSGTDSYTDPRVDPGTVLLKGEGNGLLFDDGEE